MMKYILPTLALLLAIASSQTMESCVGEVNNMPLIKQEPKLISETANGKKYLIQEGDNVLYLGNFTGSPYEMGYAYGKLFSTEIEEMTDNLINFCGNFLDDAMVDLKIPEFIRKQILSLGLDLSMYLLQLTWELAEPFTPSRYPEEFKGISDGSGLSENLIININMIPELLKASCTLVGVWNGAGKDNDLLSLRSLDWDPYAPVTQYPMIAVYHSTEEGSFPFANIGMAGLIGSLTAAGSQGITIGEKLWGGDYSTYKGKPWTFMLRDLAEFGTTLEQMADTIQNTDRTCEIHIGMASAQSEGYEGVNSQYSGVDFFTDTNYTGYSENHPQIDGIFYLEEHHGSEYDACVGNILREAQGEITWETLFRGVGGLDRTGDTQVCAIDVYTQEVYVSYSSYPGGDFGFKRSPIYVDLKTFYGTSGTLKPTHLQVNKEELEL